MRKEAFNSKNKVIYINNYVKFKESYINSLITKLLWCKDQIEKIFQDVMKDNPLGSVIRWKNVN